MSRIIDEPYFTYSAYNALTSGIQVKCPKCHGAGMVTADDDNAYFRCLSCGHQETRDRTIYRYDVHNHCKNCGRYYRVDIEDEAKQQFSVLCRARYTRRQRLSPTLLIFRTNENLISVWSFGFSLHFKENQSGRSTENTLPT